MERRKLIAERDYHVDRLTEISLELKRLTDEADALKTELDALPESDVRAIGAIRRRRRYIARRSTDLKAERTRATADRDGLREQLKVETSTISDDPTLARPADSDVESKQQSPPREPIQPRRRKVRR